jgi:cytochrome c556
MKNILHVAASLTVAAAFASLSVPVGAQGERGPSIRAVMHKQYTVKKAPFVLIKAELGSDAPDWEKVREATRSFSALAAILEHREPKWGDQASWKKFTDIHIGDAKAMDLAAEARDQPALRSVHGRLAAACKACHDVHRYNGRE